MVPTALLHGRRFLGGDVRQSQVELARRRLALAGLQPLPAAG